MTWFAAHVIMYVKYKDKEQHNYPIWENIYLIESDSIEGADKKAQLRGKAEEGDSNGSFEWDGNPARWVFGGVRKLIECQNSPEQMIANLNEEGPGDGTEISYSQFEVRNKRDLEKLINGELVKIIYAE